MPALPEPPPPGARAAATAASGATTSQAAPPQAAAYEQRMAERFAALQAAREGDTEALRRTLLRLPVGFGVAAWRVCAGEQGGGTQGSRGCNTRIARRAAHSCRTTWFI